MVWVPGGSFLYGEAETQRIESVAHGFWIDRDPVTNAQYAAFLASLPAHAIPPCADLLGEAKWFECENSFAKPQFAQHPATGVTWRGACAYCAWRAARLPLEVEWELAARGTDGRVYPWGDVFDAVRCNTDGAGTTAVDHYGQAGASPYGCRDMAGNVLEWTASDSGTGNVFRLRNGLRVDDLPLKILRGGSWIMPAEMARCALRRWDFTPVRGSRVIGFRCVQDAV
ncbi:formylglycine-generating enzyme family protein [Bryobacter aggregatus]|uniref:formylglycine-generating enzyme family protein n=1 Tax=Bryobacter aggregatus TaxID=360054 RepID=UPI00138DE156|nr:SUMF1/EgtB/PvdO family nonheme iron enzyme [Bryobacter aggregatus]